MDSICVFGNVHSWSNYEFIHGNVLIVSQRLPDTRYFVSHFVSSIIKACRIIYVCIFFLFIVILIVSKCLGVVATYKTGFYDVPKDIFLYRIFLSNLSMRIYSTVEGFIFYVWMATKLANSCRKICWRLHEKLYLH